MLTQKATGLQTALEEAKENLATLKQGDGSKQQEYDALKKEAIKVKKQLADSEGRLEVGHISKLKLIFSRCPPNRIS